MHPVAQQVEREPQCLAPAPADIRRLPGAVVRRCCRDRGLAVPQGREQGRPGRGRVCDHAGALPLAHGQHPAAALTGAQFLQVHAARAGQPAQQGETGIRSGVFRDQGEAAQEFARPSVIGRESLPVPTQWLRRVQDQIGHRGIAAGGAKAVGDPLVVQTDPAMLDRTPILLPVAQTDQHLVGRGGIPAAGVVEGVRDRPRGRGSRIAGEFGGLVQRLVECDEERVEGHARHALIGPCPVYFFGSCGFANGSGIDATVSY